MLQTLPTIQEVHEQPSKPVPVQVEEKSTAVDIISTTTLDTLIDSFVRYEVHEISSHEPQKVPFKNAIPLFKTKLYESGNICLHGNSNDFFLQPKKHLHLLKRPSKVFFTDLDLTSSSSIPLLLLDDSPSPTIPSSPSVNQTDNDDDASVSPLISPTVTIPEHDFYTEIDDDAEDDIDFDALLKSSSPTFIQSVLQDSFQPRITPADRVSSTEPKTKIMTSEYLQKCIGFRNIQPILNNLKSLTADTVSIRDTGRNPILSRGETATLPKKKSNKSTVPRPDSFGTVWHLILSMVMGSQLAESNMVYSLLTVIVATKFSLV